MIARFFQIFSREQFKLKMYFFPVDIHQSLVVLFHQSCTNANAHFWKRTGVIDVAKIQDLRNLARRSSYMINVFPVISC